MGVNTQRGGDMLDRLCLESKLLHDVTHSDSNESFFPVFLSAPNQRDAEFLGMCPIANCRVETLSYVAANSYLTEHNFSTFWFGYKMKYKSSLPGANIFAHGKTQTAEVELVTGSQHFCPRKTPSLS